MIGHILWLIGISVATSTSDVGDWVLLVALVSLLLGAGAGYLGWRHYQRASHVWAAFLWAVPVAPVLFSIVVLGVTYL